MGAKRILVVAAHPDDETLGTGASIARFAREGHEVSVLCLSRGPLSRKGVTFTDLYETEKHCRSALSVLGATLLDSGTFTDNEFDKHSLLEIVRFVESAIDGFKPDTIFTHSQHCLNVDHRITAQAVLTATRPSNRTGIYAFEIPSSTEWALSQFGSFKPNYFVEISDTLQAKLDAMSCYKSEIREYPHPRSLEGIEALAKVRGMQAGFKYGEAFETVRIIKGE